MDDKRLRDKFQELQFTKEDRQEVFKKIHKPEKKVHRFSNKFVPVLASLAVVGLCLFFVVPMMFPGNSTQEPNTSTVTEEADVFTTLLTVKSEEMDDRSYLNLLFSYSKDQKMMKVISLPTLTYAPIKSNADGTDMYNRLIFAYQFGGAENVSKTVSKLLDMPIDYYAVVDIKTFSALVDTIGGIDYDLPEDLRVRAISQVAFDFKKGMNHLNGEQIVSLMMAATEGETSLNEGDLLHLMKAVINKAETLPKEKLTELSTQIETNGSWNLALNEVNLIQPISLRDGMEADVIPMKEPEGEYVYKFEDVFLEMVVEEFTAFD